MQLQQRADWRKEFSKLAARYFLSNLNKTWDQLDANMFHMFAQDLDLNASFKLLENRQNVSLKTIQINKLIK